MKAFTLFMALAAAIQVGEPLSEEPEQTQTGLLAPWLILLAMAYGSFCATFSDIAAASHRGAFTHPLSIPTSVPEQVAGLALNGIGFGYLAGIGMTLAITPFTSVEVTYAWHFAVHSFAICLTFSLLGILWGFWSRTPSASAMLHGVAAISLGFLPIMLFPPEQLSRLWLTVAHVNPFFHLAEGFRYGVTGGTNAAMSGGLAVACTTNVVLAALCGRHLSKLRLRQTE